MKKIIKIVLLSLFMIPSMIFAESTYSEAVNYANRYIDKYDDYGKYILLDENVSYIFENNSFMPRGTTFTRGGFLSRSEYNVTLGNDSSSYLAPGIKYWTLTTASSSKKYTIDYTIKETAVTDSTGVRITEYVKPEVAVDGLGTYNTPYYFLEQYKVVIGADSTKGRTDPYTIQYASSSNSVKVIAYPVYGYQYNGNNCDKTLANIDDRTGGINNRIIEVSKVKGDLLCEALFTSKIYNFALTSEGTANIPTNSIRLKYADNWINGSSEDTITSVEKPTRTGFIFDGYEYETSTGNKIDIINSSGKIISGNTKIPGMTSINQNLKAKWIAKPISFNDQTSPAITYDTTTQTTTFTPATNGTGNYRYTVKNNGNFTIAGSIITIAGGTKAGTYSLDVNVLDTESNQTADATITIKINKKTPVISLSSNTSTFTILSNNVNFTAHTVTTTGAFSITNSNDSYATATLNNSSAVTANTKVRVDLKGITYGTTKVTVTFTPSDLENYNDTSVVHTAVVEPAYATIPASTTCNNLIYNEMEQTLAKPGSGYTLSNNTATNSGSHTVTATLIKGYEWVGGTTGNKTFNCTIQKAPTTITLSSYSDSIIVKNSISTVATISQPGTITASSNAGNIALIDITGKSINMIGKDKGAENIIFTLNPNNTNYKTSTVEFSLVVYGVIKKSAIFDLCISNLVYTGSPQKLAKESEQYILINNSATNAGEHTVIVKPANDYRWEDSSHVEENITCSIAKANPVMTISPSSTESYLYGAPYVTVNTNAPGTYNFTTSNGYIISFPNGSSISGVGKSISRTFTMNAVGTGTAKITANFALSDTTNYNPVTPKSYNITVYEPYVPVSYTGCNVGMCTCTYRYYSSSAVADIVRTVEFNSDEPLCKSTSQYYNFGCVYDASRVRQCNSGTACNNKTGECTPCTKGHYADQSGLAYCRICPDGQYQDQTGQSSCKTCPAGKYTSEVSEKITCDTCPAGLYAEGTGNTYCSSCKAGTYSSEPGTAKCKNCTDGYYSSIGATACKACGDGRSSKNDHVSCYSCNAGTYSNSSTGYICAYCSPGSYSTTNGQAICIKCSDGQYQNNYGQLSCKTCPAGTIASTVGATSCKTCAKGTYSNSSHRQCIKCPTGMTTAGTGASSSTECSIDISNPVATCTVSSDGFNGVSGTVKCDDTGSGCQTAASANFTIKSSTTYTVTDKQGNTGTCTVYVKTKTMYAVKTCNNYASCESSTCGYKTCKNVDCGCSVNASCATSGCGCKTYKSCANSACGYASCEAAACGCASCLASLFKANCTKCGYKSCATSACGYKSCATSGCGCKTYNTCANSACGCKTYKSCATSACGYASCTTSACGCAFLGWSSWSDYSYNSCAESSIKKCDSKTYYYH